MTWYEHFLHEIGFLETLGRIVPFCSCKSEKREERVRKRESEKEKKCTYSS